MSDRASSVKKAGMPGVEPEPSPSAGWRAVYALMHVPIEWRGSA